jgi:hypothetical protein
MALSIKPLPQIVHGLGSFARVCALLCTCAQAALAQNPSPAPGPQPTSMHWQLGQSKTATQITLPVKKNVRSLTLRINLEAVAVTGDRSTNPSANSSSDTSSKPTNPIPEHSISLAVHCKNQLVKTSTFTTYPLGSAGEFRLQLPKANKCFTSKQPNTQLQITLTLQQPDQTQQLTVKGAIFAEHDE